MKCSLDKALTEITDELVLISTLRVSPSSSPTSSSNAGFRIEWHTLPTGQCA